MNTGNLSIEVDDAFDHGFNSYGLDNARAQTYGWCPFSYTDLKQAWWEGWFHALAMEAASGGIRV